jgi:preflagellin peptidase FlaK
MSEILEATLEALRVLLSLTFLIYASWSDYKTREVSNNVWTILAPPAFALTFAELYLYEPSGALLSYGISFGFTAAFAIILFYTGGFGGADAKALMCLALALPFYPENLLSPISQISPISTTLFPITVFSNAVVLVIVPVVCLLLHNLYWRKKTGKELFEEDQKKEALWRKFLVLITGYKVSMNKLKEKWHLYPLEDIEENEKESKRKLIIISREESRDATVERLAKAVETGKIQDNVWASPGLPMLVFITAGLITALFYGDIVWVFVRLLLG